MSSSTLKSVHFNFDNNFYVCICSCMHKLLIQATVLTADFQMFTRQVASLQYYKLEPTWLRGFLVNVISEPRSESHLENGIFSLIRGRVISHVKEASMTLIRLN